MISIQKPQQYKKTKKLESTRINSETGPSLIRKGPGLDSAYKGKKRLNISC